MIKICLWLCVVFVILSFSTFIDPSWIPIRFINWQHKNNFYSVLRLGAPVTVFISHCLLSPKTKKALSLILIGFMGLLKGFFTLGFITILNLTSPSEWIDEEVLFTHRFENQKIILQIKPFEHRKRLVKISPITDSLEWLIPVDTTQISIYEWIKN